MRVGITALLGTLGGPRTYALGLIGAMADMGEDLDLTVFCDDPRPLEGIPRIRTVRIGLRSPYEQVIWDHVLIPAALHRHPVDVLHNLKNALPFRAPCRTVVTIHDLAPFLYPDTFARLQRWHLTTHIRHAARNADQIVTITEPTKEEIVRITKTNPEKIHVIPHGVSEAFRKGGTAPDPVALDTLKRRYGIRGRVLLYVGTIQPRKNVAMLVQAFHELRRDGRLPHQLLVVGRRGWMSRPVYRQVEPLLRSGEVIFTGPVEDGDLPLFYRLADALLNPTLYEGFGLTCLEAMACGTPVIASRTPSIESVVGDAAVLVTPGDPAGLESAIVRVVDDEELREDLARRGIARARRFSWRKSAQATLAVYRLAAERCPGRAR